VLIKIALFLLTLALAVLLSADWLLGLGIAWLPDELARLGVLLLLAGFTLILAGGSAVIGKRMWASFRDYFARPQRMMRKVLFVAERQHYLQQLLPFKAAYIAYFSDQQRKKLLVADNKKHVKLLYKATRRHLQARKAQLPPAVYRQWLQDSRRYYHLQDAPALLGLQQTLDAWEQP